MGSIQASIALQDNFTGILMNVIHAVNMSVSAIEQMQAVMSEPADMVSIQGIREQLDRATVAAQELDAAMQGIEPPAALPAFSAAVQVDRVHTDSLPVPVESVMTQQPQIQTDPVQIPVEPVINSLSPVQVPVEARIEPLDPVQVSVDPLMNDLPPMQIPLDPAVPDPLIASPEPVQVPVTPRVTEQPAVSVMAEISTDGVNENLQQMDEITARLDSIIQMQEAITSTAKSVYILPEDMAGNIAGINREISRMQRAVEFLRTNPFQLDSSIAELQIKSISEGMEELIVKQQQLDEFMGNIPSRTIEINTVAEPSVSLSPVQVPIEWQADAVPVFSNTGIERFQMEVQSTNSMLDTLSRTQAEIVARAGQTSIFSPEMAADMNMMQSRLQHIQSSVQAIENNPLNMGTDTANAGMEQLRAQLAQAAQEQEAMNRAVRDMDVSAANEAYLRLSQTVGNTERHIRDNVDEQGRFNREIQEGVEKADNLMESIKGFVAAYATMQTAGSIINLSDTMAQTQARLSMLVDVDDGGSVAELQDKIYLSAERSRGDYQQTAEAVSKLGLMAGNAFSGNDEIIAFTEQLNKQFIIAGTSAAGIDAAMLQLTQAMGSGVLRGEEYNSILEQAPNIIQNIAGYIEGNEDVLGSVAAAMDMKMEDLAGNVQGYLKDIAGEGLISAEMVKASMFYAADETNEKFDSMPRTFEQIWKSFRSTALMEFQPVLQRMNEMANSEAFQKFTNHAVGSLTVISGIALDIFDLLVGTANIAADNWSWLSPVIYGVAGALMAYYGAMLLYNTVTGISAAITTAKAFAEKVHAASLAMEAKATFAATAAQYGFNAALLACPLTWIIVLIIVVVAVFYAFAGTSVSVAGIVAGAFFVLGAHILNGFLVPLWNGFAAFINFIGNAWNDPIAAIKVAFYDMCLTVLGYIRNLASAIESLINKIPGVTVDITGGLDSFYSSLEQAQQAVKDESGWVEYVKRMDFIDYGTAWDKGYSFGERIDDSIAGFDLTALFDTNIPNPDDYTDLNNYDYGGSINDIAADTGKMAGSMDITQEELKYLRDIAEQETINRFTTAEIRIDQSGMKNTIQNGMDLDGVISEMTEAVSEAVEVAAEGVHV